MAPSMRKFFLGSKNKVNFITRVVLSTIIIVIYYYYYFLSLLYILLVFYSRMNIVKAAAVSVRDVDAIPVEKILWSLKEATRRRRNRPLFDKVEGETFVVGPIRGHGSDFAHYLLSAILPNDTVPNIVFLGNYINGAPQGLSVLYLVALLILHSDRVVVPLIGKHEFLYPVAQENFGSLENELELRAINAGVRLEDYELIVKDFFSCLSVGCTVDNLFFCTAGGLASTFAYVSELCELQGLSHEHTKEFILNSPMDEDEERMSEGYAFIRSPDEIAYKYTFNAACNFISRNKLASTIVGMEYYIDRSEYDSFSKPNHYKVSVFFPGYTLGRVHPVTRLPGVISVFSAPKFCDYNLNNACILQISRNRILIRELSVFEDRKLIFPAPQDHFFSWAQPIIEKAVVFFARQFIFNHKEGMLIKAKYSGKQNEDEEEPLIVSKAYRMCQLLLEYNLPFPIIPKNKAKIA